MTHIISANITASITELKTNPMQVMAEAEGAPVAILNRNKPTFYCVPAELYERLMERLDDVRLAEIVREREGQEEIPVTIDQLMDL